MAATHSPLHWARCPSRPIGPPQVLTDPDVVVVVVVVVPIVAVHGAQVPWGKVVTDGVPVVAARRLPSMLRQLPTVLGPERVAGLADQARLRFHAAA
jgi:hypothetical protein